jgi:hypothetical protein
MLSINLLALILCGGILAGPFRIAEAEPGHHQGCLRAAMASDGHFAVSWKDSLQPLGARLELDLYIRFFGPDGNPLTDPYEITKVVDTNQICGSHLDMDSAGSTVLLWTEYPGLYPTNEDLLRLQLFDTSGSPLGSPQTDHQGYINTSRAVGVSLNDQGEFAIAWDREGVIWARRYSFEGGPQGDSFVVHGDLPDVSFHYPGVALSDAGDLVVTWYEFGPSYPRFQVFDAEDESILPWEPRGHLVLDDSLGGTRVEAYWLDNDRFVLFWIDHAAWPWNVAGRVFADRGLTRYPICRLVHDSLGLTWPDPAGRFAIALSSDERFAETHIRSYTDRPDTSDPSKKRWWDHGGGILGYIQDNEPIRRTTLFEYTPPWGADTVNSIINNYPRTQPPAVACCDDRLVWVYSRLNTDTIFEAWAIITDWDMGVGVVEPPIVEKPSNWEVVTSIGSQIVLRYHDRPDGFRASIFDALGRKVDELMSPSQEGVLIWGENRSSGVYFIVPQDSQAPALKVVLVR